MFMGYQVLCKESMLAVWLVCPTFLGNGFNLARDNLVHNCELDLRPLGIWKWDHSGRTF